VTNFQDHA